MKKTLSILFVLALVLSFSVVSTAPVGADTSGIVIDGVISPGEWDDYFWFTDDDEPKMTGYLAFDTENMYIAVIVENDGIAGSRDHLLLYIDVPPVLVFNDGRDAIVVGAVRDGWRYQEHPHQGGTPVTWYPEDADYPEGLEHDLAGLDGEERVYEFKIPFAMIPAGLGDTIGLKFSARNTGPGAPGTDELNFYPDHPEGISPVRSSTWVTVEGNHEHVWIPTEKVETEAPTGPCEFQPSRGSVEDLEAVPAVSPAPRGVSFPHGMFEFKITGLTPGATVTLTIELPQAVPVGTVWWKYQDGRWYSLPNETDDGDNIMVIELTDGGLGDADGIADGVITDPGGPGNPVPPLTVGWEGSSVNKAGVMAPWIALLATMMAGATLLVVRRRRAQI